MKMYDVNKNFIHPTYEFFVFSPHYKINGDQKKSQNVLNLHCIFTEDKMCYPYMVSESHGHMLRMLQHIPDFIYSDIRTPVNHPLQMDVLICRTLIIIIIIL